MTVYLIRHGQSEFNVVHEAGGTDPMIFDAPLTALGRTQAQKVRETIRDLNIQQVITSPLTRAIQTAMGIFEGNAPIKVMAGHRELISHSCDIGRAPDLLKIDFPALSFDHLSDIWWHQGPTNETGIPIEPHSVFQARINQFRDYLRSMADRPVAVVGHGDTFMELAGFGMANCEVRRYEI